MRYDVINVAIEVFFLMYHTNDIGARSILDMAHTELMINLSHREFDEYVRLKTEKIELMAKRFETI